MPYRENRGVQGKNSERNLLFNVSTPFFNQQKKPNQFMVDWGRLSEGGHKSLRRACTRWPPVLGRPVLDTIAQNYLQKEWLSVPTYHTKD